MYVVKFDYESEKTFVARTKTLAFQALVDARKLYDRLEMGVALEEPVPTRGGTLIDVLGAWLYRSDADDPRSAVRSVIDGTATLIDEAKVLELNIDL